MRPDTDKFEYKMLFVYDKNDKGSDYNVKLQQWVLPEKRGREKVVRFEPKTGEVSESCSSHTSDHLKISLVDEKGELQLHYDEGNKGAFEGSYQQSEEDAADKKGSEIESGQMFGSRANPPTSTTNQNRFARQGEDSRAYNKTNQETMAANVSGQ